MKYFYSFETKGFYAEEMFDLYPSLPEDLVALKDGDYEKLQEALRNGCYIKKSSRGYPQFVEQEDDSTLVEERYWRDSELKRADVELLKVQDGDPDACGTVGEWRNYRKELRAWPEHEDFPSRRSRPIAPDKEVKR